ncbi:uncharacterized protein [Clytia hemisphaerica]|uniref:Uncharacterized protein n=1 Tax=Clytia hemisphaerica TaxID=252671 RepID=A0A7M5VC33_9CNID
MMNNALQTYNGELSLITRPMPKVTSPNDVLIKVTHAGVCGTDLSIIAGRFEAAKKIIQGHEFSGVVSGVGAKVKHLKIGDRICVNPYNYCGSCAFCVRGQPQFCVKEAMKTALGYQKDGGFQEYIVLPGHLCFPLPPTMQLRQSVFCQPLSTILRGWDNMGKIALDSKVLIAGAGIVGLLWASLFHFHGYRDVTISEINDQRKEMAARLNLGYPARHPKDIGDDYKAAETNGDLTWGFDVIVDCSGNKRAVEDAFRWLRHGATFVLFGVCGKGVNVSFEGYSIYQKELRIVSSFLNRFSYARTVNLVHHMSDRYLDFKHLEVASYSLHDYEAALDALRKGVISKAVFEF